MSPRKLRTIGVLGGMGPEAGACYLEQLAKACLAERGQDHPPVLLFSLPQVPDRTEAILPGGPSPVPAIRHGLRVLERAGADFAVISCVSAHYFLPRIAPRSQTDTLFHKSKAFMSFIFGGEADNHAVNTVPKETLVRITKAEDGGMGGEGIWKPATTGHSPTTKTI